jgi:hypothetical protein
VDGEGSFVEIAFELKASLADEAFVCGIMADGGKVFP